ncbi:MAG: restriction endonuclease subunit S [Candidatus Methanomethylicaceae archaeon]
MSQAVIEQQTTGKLPELSKGWVWTTVENCVDILDGKRVPVNEEEREKRIAGKPKSQLVPYYGATGQVGWIDDFLFEEELLLVGEDGAPFLEPAKHKAYIIKGKTWVNNHAHVLRAVCDLTSNAYLCYYLNFFDYHGYVTGTTRLKLNQAPLRKIPVPLPPLPEQRRIVAKIEELFTKLDAGVEALKKTKALLKRYRQAVLKAAVEGRLTKEWREAHKGELEPASALLERILKERRDKWEAEQRAKGKDPKKLKYKEPVAPDTSRLPELPKGWVWAVVDQLAPTASGGTPSRKRPEYFDGNIPWLKSGELNDGLVTDTKERITKEALDNSSAKIFPKGTLLIALYGATVGKLGILELDAATNQAICAIFLPLHVNTKYIFYYFMKIRKVIIRTGKGGAQPNISQEMVNKIAVPLPPLPEQHRIVEEVERRLSIADEVEAIIEANLKRAERLRQSILKKAFGGKLVPQDPSDEPASVLLERIKTEKAKREAEKKATKRQKTKSVKEQMRLM